MSSPRGTALLARKRANYYKRLRLEHLQLLRKDPDAYQSELRKRFCRVSRAAARVAAERKGVPQQDVRKKAANRAYKRSLSSRRNLQWYYKRLEAERIELLRRNPIDYEILCRKRYRRCYLKAARVARERLRMN